MITSFNTDVALANLFACRSTKFLFISPAGLEEYIKFIQTGNPLFMSTDFSKAKMLECVAQFPGYYKVKHSMYLDDIAVHNRSSRRPSLDYFMKDYDVDDRKYVKRLTELWLQERTK